MADAKKKNYLVKRGFFAAGERNNPGDVVTLTEQEAGVFNGKIEETEAKAGKAAKRSTKAEGLPK